MDVACDLQSPRGMARGEQRAVDRLGAVEFSYASELRFHQLRFEPDGLEILRHGLADIDDLWKPWQGVEVQSELKALGIDRLRQECLGPGRIIAVQLLEA